MLILGDAGLYTYERETLGVTDQCNYTHEYFGEWGVCVCACIFLGRTG